MKTYRMTAVMTGVLYLLGTVFGVLGAVVGGEVISSLVKTSTIAGPDLMDSIVSHLPRLVGGSFFILLMGVSLVMMTVFLYPIFTRDSKELALGMLLFRGALEGAWYFFTAMGVVYLSALGNEYIATGADSAALRSVCISVYRFLDILGPAGTIFFLIGTTCLYLSFYRTRLIPRWLSVWGLIGVIPYLAYAWLHYFSLDHGAGLYLQMLLAPQEIVMALWLIFKGFNRAAVAGLMNGKNIDVGH